MTELNQIYKCEVCGNIVELVHAGKGQMVCCGKSMALMNPNTQDASLEKHVPVIENTPDGVMVKIGSAPHPMVEEHYIEWIEILADGKVYRKHLKPGDSPEAEFCIKAENIVARELCNIHGLWQKS